MTARQSEIDAHMIAMIKLPMLHLPSWHTPATDLPRQEYDGWRIHTIRYTPGIYDFYGMSGFGLYQVEKSLPITTLQERRGSKWRTWMVDDPPHWYAMQRYARFAKGRVFMGGLGLGLALRAYLTNMEVTKLTVVDRSAAAQRLVRLPHDPRVDFMRGDALEVAKFYADRGFEYDHVLLDLWVANGQAEKKWLDMTEVAPMVEAFRALWPKAEMLVHGFWPYTHQVGLHLRQPFEPLFPADAWVTPA